MCEREIFLNALERDDPVARAAYLAAACGGRPALRRRIEELLRSHQQADTFLNVPAMEQLAAAEESLGYLEPALEPDSLGRLDHYEVLEIVGRGGAGMVLKARDTKLQRIVAIKVLARRLAGSGTARQRFVHEAQAAAAVRDDNVVAIYAVGDDGPVPYLVMEFINGITLEGRIRQAGALELKEILRIGIQVANGLAAAHAQGVIHRDIKPGNVLLENGVQRVKITDFGLASAAADAGRTDIGFFAGTPLYMSPEQARGEGTDHRTDLFSLGSVLYTLCAGRPPFLADTTAAVLKRVVEETPQPIRSIQPNAPEWLCDVIGKLHAKEKTRRYTSAREVADLLTEQLALLQQPPQSTSPPAAQAKPTETESKGSGILTPWWWRLVLATCLVLLLAIVILIALPKLWWRPLGEHTPGATTQPAEITPEENNRPRLETLFWRSGAIQAEISHYPLVFAREEQYR
jgi:serine/threonine protein kinase